MPKKKPRTAKEMGKTVAAIFVVHGQPGFGFTGKNRAGELILKKFTID